MIGNVSRETTDRLAAYESLIIRWNARINLVAPSTIANLRDRHIQDCLQIARHAQPDGGLWADLGSGGGLPGIVLAIVFAHTRTEFNLIESDQRKAAFLRTVIRELGLSRATVLPRRIEDVKPLKAAYVSARALAPLPRLMAYLMQHMAHDGEAWVMKGQRWQEELQAAKVEWNFNAEILPSQTMTGAAILKINGVQHA
ncbi:16S rRNA (guanine(527)-N(7))-methyltransferase RsmG [Paracoccus salsus]|uniref:16S rRNA (guanine(527)-N(7))-methyltransferase RsmG n=1 Tax=Paracoccus salsus TaxID=2911061 RepID=UPI001F30AE00|nr:16S rRNA (guanine(527)-N(7))-methyltransferase RsmG [Paracoccus salsus]MCF3974345.1 16S rRNA (guanine(527)-N(7))-methyltransferase RsmG [Paracoccus salsus]